MRCSLPIAIFLAACAFLSPARAVDSVLPVVLGYYLAGNGVAPADLDYTLFTHLAVAFTTVNESEKPKWPNDPAVQDLITRAHAANVQVLASLGGSGSGVSLNRLARHPGPRAAFLAKLVPEIVAKGFDGCDVDWEFPGANDGSGMADFIHALATNLRAANPHALVTMAVPTGDYYGKFYPMEQMIGDLDLVQVMTYDVHGPWKDGAHYSHSGHNSPLNTTDTDRIDGEQLSFPLFAGYWENRGIPVAKLLVGIPCYGHGFAVTDWAQIPKRASRYPEPTYTDVLQLMGKPGWEAGRDTEAGVPFLKNAQEKELISYDDNQSAQAKGAWARGAGLRGIFFWELSQDRVNGQNILVRAGRAGFSPPVVED